MQRCSSGGGVANVPFRMASLVMPTRVRSFAEIWNSSRGPIAGIERREHVEKEKGLAVADPREPGTETAGCPALVLVLVLVAAG